MVELQKSGNRAALGHFRVGKTNPTFPELRFGKKKSEI